MEAVQDSSGPSVFANFLRAMAVRCQCSDGDLARLPKTGPVVIVTNHPFGMIEGAILAALAARVRTDFKIVANSFLAGIPALARLRNCRRCIRRSGPGKISRSHRGPPWIGSRGSGMLITFPAGEVSSLQLSSFQIADPAWSESVARLIQLTRASALPAFFHGGNQRPRIPRWLKD